MAKKRAGSGKKIWTKKVITGGKPAKGPKRNPKAIKQVASAAKFEASKTTWQRMFGIRVEQKNAQSQLEQSREKMKEIREDLKTRKGDGRDLKVRFFDLESACESCRATIKSTRSQIAELIDEAGTDGTLFEHPVNPTAAEQAKTDGLDQGVLIHPEMQPQTAPADDKTVMPAAKTSAKFAEDPMPVCENCGAMKPEKKEWREKYIDDWERKARVCGAVCGNQLVKKATRKNDPKNPEEAVGGGEDIAPAG